MGALSKMPPSMYVRLHSWRVPAGGTASHDRPVMLWPGSGPWQLPSRTTSSSGHRNEQSQSWRGRNANGKAPEASAVWLTCSGPMPERPLSPPSSSCASPESRPEASGAETILGCPSGSTSKRQGTTKRCLRTGRPATVRSSG